MANLYANNSFHQESWNEAKMGAYYTDLEHVRDIRKLLTFPEGKEVTIMDPCAGNCAALKAVAGYGEEEEVSLRKLFAVELNDRVFEEISKDSDLTDVVKGDFTHGIAIKHDSFSMIFCNPPYLKEKDDDGRNERSELAFLDGCTTYLKKGGVLIWVVSVTNFTDKVHLRKWMKNFETMAIYKFREPEFSKFHQLVAVGKKVASKNDFSEQERLEFFEKWQLNDLPELPKNGSTLVSVPEGEEKAITLFTTTEFDPNKAYDILSQKGLTPEMKNFVGKHIKQASYVGMTAERPPIELKKDVAYMLAVSGFDQGFAGSEGSCDLHLRSASAKQVARLSYNQSKDDDWDDDEGDEKPGTVTETVKAEIEMVILSNNGEILHLK